MIRPVKKVNSGFQLQMLGMATVNKPKTEMFVGEHLMDIDQNGFSQLYKRRRLVHQTDLQGGAPLVISWFINPSNDRYIYHKP